MKKEFLKLGWMKKSCAVMMTTLLFLESQGMVYAAGEADISVHKEKRDEQISKSDETLSESEQISAGSISTEDTADKEDGDISQGISQEDDSQEDSGDSSASQEDSAGESSEGDATSQEDDAKGDSKDSAASQDSSEDSTEGDKDSSSDAQETDAYEKGTCGNQAKWQLLNGVLIISGSGYIYDYEEYGEKAPWAKKTVTSLVIKEGITGIGRYAFANMSSIKTVALPSTLKSIKEGAFSNCSALTSIDIPQKVDNVSAYAFAWCTSLKKISGCKGLNGFGYYAFGGCKALQSYTISRVYFDTFFAFDDCTSLTIKGSMGQGITYTVKNGQMKIYGSGKIPNYSYSSLSKKTVDEETGDVRRHGSGAKAWEGISISSIKISKKISAIGSYAFAWCEDVTKLNALGVTTIGKCAFRHTYSMEELVLTAKLKDVATAAFKRNHCKHPVLYYTGSKSAFSNINFKSGNSSLQNAYVQYECEVKSFSASSKGDGSIGLQWQRNKNTNGYEIYRATSKYGTYEKIATLTSNSKNSYINKNCTMANPYYYKVRAYSDKGTGKIYGSWSQIIEARALPRQPKNLVARAGNISTLITWNAVKGVDGYLITKSGGGETETIWVSSKKTKYVDLDVEQGTTYTYKIVGGVNYEHELYTGSSATVKVKF